MAPPTAHLMPNLAGLGQGVNALDYLSELVSIGADNYFDVFSYHAYPTTYDVSVLEGFLENVKQLIGDMPTWITETAASSEPNDYFENASPSGQARWVVKHYVFHLANSVERVFWLDVDDTSPGVPNPKHYGLRTWDGTKKPSFYTFKLMTSKLGGFTSVEKITLGQYKFNFSGKGPVYVLWADSSTTVDLTPYVGSGDVLLTHVIEEESQTTPTVETVSASNVPIGESPIFVEVM